MKIVIVGCGKVGETVAYQLNNEGHEITVIDTDGVKLHSVVDRLDVMGVEGNGATTAIQIEAGVKYADLLIACTSSDELNMLCCLIAKKLGEHCQTIARVRNPEYASEIHFLSEELNLSYYINPENAAAREIVRAIKFPSAIKVDTFAKGRVELLAFEIPEGSVIHNMKVMDINNKFHSSVLICSVERNKEVTIPDGNFVLQAHDIVSIVSGSSQLGDFLNSIGIEPAPINNVMIIGGGRIGYYLAKMLEDSHMKVKIIEKDQMRCQGLSESLKDALVLCGDGIDEQMILEEGVNTADAFCALTDFDEENIMLSLFAGSFHHAKLFTKIDKVRYEDVISNLNVGSTIQPKQITADRISRYVRAMQNTMGCNVQSLVKISNGKAEALEFLVKKDASVIGIPLQELQLKDNLLLACINRRGKIITPRGKDAIEAGDTVVVVTTHTGLKDLQDILK